MKRIKPSILLGAASALLVVAFVAWDSRTVSPGTLSAVHAQAGIAENDCESCHGDAQRPMAAACGDCHPAITQQIASNSGFHGTLDADPSRCGACHEEHHGADLQLAGPRSFALAGVTDRNAFRHEKLGFELSGVHAGLSCKSCHEHADDVVLARDCPRFLGEQQSCASCHADPHAGKLPDCATCHGQEDAFAKVARFRHPDSFALTGAHAEPGCVDCHPKDTAWAVEASGVAAGTAQVTRPARTCVQCHATPHETSFLARVAGVVATASGAECATCHTVENDSFRHPDAAMPAELHALAGFPLVPPHAELACSQCHSAGERLSAAPDGSDAKTAFRALHPGRSAGDCQACHGDPHGGQFEKGAFAQESCRVCHDPLKFTPPAFDVGQHERTAFPLTGAHGAVACSACHAKPHDEEPRRFRGTSDQCDSCHADAHGGYFERTTGAADALREDGCALCHSTTSFSVLEQPFDHGLWTGIPLRGAHTALACTVCHPTAAAPDSTGRTFGRWYSNLDSSPFRCGTCHLDVHGDAFARQPQRAIPVVQPDCVSCHSDERFQGARADFDHAGWTEFPLTGAHARATCESCHVPRAQPDQLGRQFGVVAQAFPGPADDCRTCHVDPHAGRFDKPGMPAEVGGERGCERCHTTAGFDAASTNFDHGRWTGFALEGAHARAACQSCHAPAPGSDRAGFVRARGTSCQSCHADPHAGQFSRAGATDCAACHTPASTFEALVFDHQRDARFALDATHAQLDCSSCHVPTPLADGRRVVRYKPLGTVCGDCHDPRGGR